MNLSTLGILPRIGLAIVPWLSGEIFDIWFPGCFFSESPFCIYYWHPPGMDVVFALLVLGPFITARKLITFRLLALILLSVFVHAVSVDLLVGTRGLLELPGVDSIFVNIVPIAVVASIVTVSFAALACGLAFTWRLLVYSSLAGMPVASLFLLIDIGLATSWLPFWDNWYWAVWHVSICIAIYYGRRVKDSTHA